MKRLLFIIILLGPLGCLHSPKVINSYRENVVNAPIDLVWEKTLLVLSAEGVTLSAVSKFDYLISGRTPITSRSWLGNDIQIRLSSMGEVKTYIFIEAGARVKLFDWGGEERTLQNLFQKIKVASEHRVLSEPEI